MTGRAPFHSSPRPVPPPDLVFARAMRRGAALVVCFRREAGCPRLVTRCGWRVWRWLAMPAGFPLAREP